MTTVNREYCPVEDAITGFLFCLWLVSVSLIPIVGGFAVFAIVAATAMIELTEGLIKASKGEKVSRIVALIWTGL